MKDPTTTPVARRRSPVSFPADPRYKPSKPSGETIGL